MRKLSFPLAALSAVSALAHDMYIMPGTFRPDSGAKVTVGFHVGDAFPESEVAGRIARLREPKLIWKNGGAAFTNLRIDGKRDAGDAVVAGSGHVIAAVSTTPSLITLAPAKFTSYLKHEGLTPTIAWRAEHGESAKPGKERYSKFAKAILLSGVGNGFATAPIGYLIEIVPEADPYALKAGDSLPIQVLFRGKPAADLQIESAWAGPTGAKKTVVGRTGADGRFRFPVPAAGRFRIHTIQMERCAEPAVADWESFWASLTFEVR